MSFHAEDKDKQQQQLQQQQQRLMEGLERGACCFFVPCMHAILSSYELICQPSTAQAKASHGAQTTTTLCACTSAASSHRPHGVLGMCV